MNNERIVVHAREAIDEWFVLVIVTLLALSLLGGWLTFTALAAPADETDEQTVDAWSSTGGFEHSAVVETENEVFDVGSELTDRTTYFTAISPELEGHFEYWYDAEDGDTTVDLSAEHVVRAVDDEEEYWVVNETLETATADGVEPGEEQSIGFTVDVPTVENETDAIEESLGGSPGTVESVVLVEVTMEGTVEGDSVERTDTYELVIDADGDTYTVDASDHDERFEERTESVQEAGSGGLFGLLVPLSLFVGSLGAAVALTAAKHNGSLAPSRRELERVTSTYERDQFDEWISRGRLPDGVRDRPCVEVESLEDLVDVAIDCDRRVIEDDDGYYVVDGALLYSYESPAKRDEGGLEDTSVERADDVTASVEEDVSASVEDDVSDGDEDSLEERGE